MWRGAWRKVRSRVAGRVNFRCLEMGLVGEVRGLGRGGVHEEVGITHCDVLGFFGFGGWVVGVGKVERKFVELGGGN